MSVSRLLQVADAVADRIRAASADPVDAADVGRAYLFRVPDPDAGLKSTPRRVLVIPQKYAQAKALTRGTDANDYTVNVLVVEGYPGAGDPPDAWLDSRLELVERLVYGQLSNARGDYLMLPGGAAVSQAGGVEVAYDLVILEQHGVFWSESEFTFREHA